MNRSKIILYYTSLCIIIIGLIMQLTLWGNKISVYVDSPQAKKCKYDYVKPYFIYNFEKSLFMWSSNTIFNLYEYLKIQKSIKDSNKCNMECCPVNYTTYIEKGTLYRIEQEEIDKFPYVFQDDPPSKITITSIEQGIIEINKSPIYIRLIKKDSLDWLKRQSAETIKGIKVVGLSGNHELDIPALNILANNKVIINFDYHFQSKLDNALIKAIVQSKPSGIVACSHIRLDDIVSELTELKYLYLTVKKIPKLKNLKKLHYLGLILERGKKASLKEINSLKDLHSLFLCEEDYSSYSDLSQISKLKGLRYLSLQINKIDIAALTELKELQAITLLSAYDIKNISRIKRLSNLEHVFISPMELNDYSHLKGLAKLQSLVIMEKDFQKKYKEKFGKEITKDFPNCDIVEFNPNVQYMIWR